MNPKIILIVDDNPYDRDLLRRAFRASGIWNEIVMAADGQQALNYLFGDGTETTYDRLGAVQLVILDVNMPHLGGVETLRRLRADERTRKLPVVILTGSPSEEDRSALEQLGIAEFVRKPTDTTQFIEATAALGLKWILTRDE